MIMIIVSSTYQGLTKNIGILKPIPIGVFAGTPWTSTFVMSPETSAVEAPSAGEAGGVGFHIWSCEYIQTTCHDVTRNVRAVIVSINWIL